VNPAGSRAESDPPAIRTSRNVAEQTVHRVPSCKFAPNNPFAIPSRCIPQACSSLPPGYKNPIAVVAPRSGPRGIVLIADRNPFQVVVAAILKVLPEGFDRAGSQNQTNRTCADIYSLSVRAPSERQDPSPSDFLRVDQLTGFGIVEEESAMDSRRKQPA
jgi:hypothetical protein